MIWDFYFLILKIGKILGVVIFSFWGVKGTHTQFPCTVVFVFVVFAVSFLSLSPLRDIICNPFQTNVSLSLISFQISMCYFSFSLISFQIIKFPSAIFTPWSVLNDKWGHSRQFNLWTYFHQSRKILGNDGGKKK